MYKNNNTSSDYNTNSTSTLEWDDNVNYYPIKLNWKEEEEKQRIRRLNQYE